jgi:uncharacterized protein (UPF0332 family)
LLALKGYISKSYDATLLFLLKYFIVDLSIEEIKMFDKLFIDKQDAELYFSLKQKRKQTSYSTNILFSDYKVIEYQKRVISFVNKVERIVNK